MKQFCLIAILVAFCALAVCDDFEYFWQKADPFGCKKPGLACASCEQTIICTDLGSGDWDITEIDKCDVDNGWTCLNGQCVNTTNPNCKESVITPFPCNSIGMFPDPFDCQIFHICCERGLSYGQKCEGDGFGYDPASTTCKNKVPEAGCARPVPECKQLGERAALTSNKNIYYICSVINDSNNNTVLYPVMHKCPNGKNFANDKCT